MSSNRNCKSCYLRRFNRFWKTYDRAKISRYCSYTPYTWYHCALLERRLARQQRTKRESIHLNPTFDSPVTFDIERLLRSTLSRISVSITHCSLRIRRDVDWSTTTAFSPFVNFPAMQRTVKSHRVRKRSLQVKFLSLLSEGGCNVIRSAVKYIYKGKLAYAQCCSKRREIMFNVTWVRLIPQFILLVMTFLQLLVVPTYRSELRLTLTWLCRVLYDSVDQRREQLESRGLRPFSYNVSRTVVRGSVRHAV